nr:hypothetical protein [Tanacetum cinerariifolium]
VLLSGNGRVLPGEAELRTGQRIQDARAHRAGLVLHAVLRDLAGDPGQAHGGHGHGRGDRGAPRARIAVTGVYVRVLRLLHPDAVLHAHGEDKTGSGKGDWLMKKLLAVFILAALPVLSFAAEHGGPELESVDIDVSDKVAMQDGARTFVNYCMGCHSAKFQRYERVADDLGIPHELMLDKMVFTGAKIGDHMVAGMQPA